MNKVILRVKESFAGHEVGDLIVASEAISDIWIKTGWVEIAHDLAYSETEVIEAPENMMLPKGKMKVG